jgi:hypothetical protein
MKVSEFIEWLKTQDQEATVRVLVAEFRNGCDITKEVDFTPELSYYCDLRGNPFVKVDSPVFNQVTLLLGEN